MRNYCIIQSHQWRKDNSFKTSEKLKDKHQDMDSVSNLFIFYITADRFARIINFDGGKLMVDSAPLMVMIEPQNCNQVEFVVVFSTRITM